MKQEKVITRKHLLTANLGLRQITAVEITHITFEPGQFGGLHLHPCPVTGYIVSGTAVMQVEGQGERVLNAGDGFYEPADTPIIQFSNYSETVPMEFVAFYLVNGSQELIKML